MGGYGLTSPSIPAVRGSWPPMGTSMWVVVGVWASAIMARELVRVRSGKRGI